MYISIYFNELAVAPNDNYASHRIISEWLEVINDVIEGDMLDRVHNCYSIELMCDESTDISKTKDLILFAHILFNKENKTHFLKFVHLADGKVDTIQEAIVL